MTDTRLVASDLYDAKKLAIATLGLTKTQTHALVIERGYDDNDSPVGWVALYKGKKLEIFSEVTNA